jgi:hypothetical protein
VTSGKNTLYFDADNGLFNGVAFCGKYPVMISITYLDAGTGSWRLFADGRAAPEASIAVSCTQQRMENRFCCTDRCF